MNQSVDTIGLLYDTYGCTGNTVIKVAAEGMIAAQLNALEAEKAALDTVAAALGDYDKAATTPHHLDPLRVEALAYVRSIERQIFKLEAIKAAIRGW